MAAAEGSAGRMLRVCAQHPRPRPRDKEEPLTSLPPGLPAGDAIPTSPALVPGWEQISLWGVPVFPALCDHLCPKGWSMS